MVKIIDANEDDYAAKFDLLTFEGFDAIDSGHAPNQFGRNGHDLIAFGQSSPRTPKKNNKVTDEIFGTMVVVRWWMGKQNNWVGNKQTKTVLTNCIASFEKYRDRVPNLNFPIYDFDHSFDIESYLVNISSNHWWYLL